MKILVIGAGNMGLTFAEAMSSSTLTHPEDLLVYDINDELIKTLETDHRFTTVNNLHDAVQQADLILIAVKPYHANALFEDIKPYLNQEQLLISLMAGYSMAQIQQRTGLSKIVRAMPNLPAKVSKGVTAFTESSNVSRIEELMVRNLLDSTGVAIHVPDEDFINKATAISGSGPAYVFYFMQAMFEAAEKMGFSPEDASTLVTQTFEGAIELFKKADLAPDGWIQKVASKGGTTQAALDSMTSNNVKNAIKDAAYAAFNRAVEIAQEN